MTRRPAKKIVARRNTYPFPPRPVGQARDLDYGNVQADVDMMEMEQGPFPDGLSVQAYIDRLPGEIIVRTEWSANRPIDRPNGMSWALRLTHVKLAQRLVNAINAGAVYTDAYIGTDVMGCTYVVAHHVPMLGRKLNADLARIGY